MAIEIRETPIGGKLDDFLDVVDDIYASDPCFVRPIDMDLKNRLSKKNPFFEHGEATTFTAFRNGKCVGRCSASIDRGHLDLYQDDVGFFGFFDTVDDQEVADALLEAARKWLTKRGMKKMRGPLSLNINEELGCLIEGFNTPPMVLMPHHRPYQAGLIEKAGLEKIKDLFAWRYEVGHVPRRAQKALVDTEADDSIKIRNVDMKNFERDIRVTMEVFNDAWSENWSFVPLTETELRQVAKDLRPILRPELTFIAEIDGVPSAVAMALPNVNEAIADLNGKLLPFGLLKLLWRLKVKGTKTGRLVILGISKKYRMVRRYAALSAALYAKMNAAAQTLGLEWGELSWTLEDNVRINAGIKFMGGKIYKKYRIFESEI